MGGVGSPAEMTLMGCGRLAAIPARRGRPTVRRSRPPWRAFPRRRWLGRAAGGTGIARLYRLSPEVLQPAFDDATDHGYLVRHDDTLTVTPVGEREIGKIVDAFMAWLAEEVDDWDLEDPSFHHALDSMAAWIVEQDLGQDREATGLLAASGT